MFSAVRSGSLLAGAYVLRAGKADVEAIIGWLEGDVDFAERIGYGRTLETGFTFKYLRYGIVVIGIF